MKKTMFCAVVFAVTGLLGPLISLMMLPMFKLGKMASMTMYEFFYNLTILLWPAWWLAIAEINIGYLTPGILATMVNVILFGSLGLVITIISKMTSRTIAVYFTYVLLWILIILWALWGAGFSIIHVDFCALAIALLLCTIPFYIAVRIYRGDNKNQTIKGDRDVYER